MMRPSQDVAEALQEVGRTRENILAWIREWRVKELEALPFTGIQSVALQQGRCQVLSELEKLLDPSPAPSAKPQYRGS